MSGFERHIKSARKHIPNAVIVKLIRITTLNISLTSSVRLQKKFKKFKVIKRHSFTFWHRISLFTKNSPTKVYNFLSNIIEREISAGRII